MKISIEAWREDNPAGIDTRSNDVYYTVSGVVLSCLSHIASIRSKPPIYPKSQIAHMDALVNRPDTYMDTAAKPDK